MLEGSSPIPETRTSAGFSSRVKLSRTQGLLEVFLTVRERRREGSREYQERNKRVNNQCRDHLGQGIRAVRSRKLREVI